MQSCRCGSKSSNYGLARCLSNFLMASVSIPSLLPDVARSTFQTGKNAAAQGIRTHLLQLSCQSGSWRETEPAACKSAAKHPESHQVSAEVGELQQRLRHRRNRTYLGMRERP